MPANTVVDLPTITRAAIDALVLIGPPTSILSALLVLAAYSTSRGRPILRLARLGLQDLGSSSRPILLRGTLLPFVGALGLIVAFSIEREVRLGPNRSIDGLAPSEEQAFWVLQAGTGHFMNHSRIDAVPRERLRRAATEHGLDVVPFWAELILIERDSGPAITGYLFAIPTSSSPELRPGWRCQGSASRCDLRSGEVVTDAGDGFDVGSRMMIRGEPLTVVGHVTEPRSLLNRAVVTVGLDTFTALTRDLRPYGLVVAAPDEAAVRSLLEDLRLSTAVEVRSTASLREENTRFWAGNGTLLLLLLIVMIALFAGTALYASRRAEVEHDAPFLWTLRALGLTSRGLRLLVLLRGQTACLIVVPVAAGAAAALITGTNALLVGFHARVDLTIVGAASGLLLISDAVASTIRSADPFSSQGVGRAEVAQVETPDELGSGPPRSNGPRSSTSGELQSEQRVAEGPLSVGNDLIRWRDAYVRPPQAEP